jgi:hypothetical protein
MYDVLTNKNLPKLFVSVFDNKDINQFNPRFIDLMFINKFVCMSVPFNALNTAIFLAGQYIESFKNNEKKQIAEQKAIKIIDIMIKNGARPLDNEYANTLSIAMICANINILKFLIDANLELKPCNSAHICTSDYCTLYYAFEASQKTKNPEFLKIALINGALIYRDGDILMTRILESSILSLVDFIVLGGDKVNSFFFSQSNTLLFEYPLTEESIEQFELFACVSDVPVSYFKYRIKHISNSANIKIMNNYISLLTGRYLEYGTNNNKYKKPAEMKQRFESKTRLLIEAAMGYEKCNTARKTTIGNIITSLPIVCTDIIAEYEYTPRFNIIDWANYK